MSGSQTAAGLYEDVEHFLAAAPLLTYPLLECKPVDQFHRNEESALHHADVEYGNDIGMVELGNGERFAIQTRAPLGRDRTDFIPLLALAQALAQALYRHIALQLRVVCCIYNAHPTRSDALTQLVTTQLDPGQ